MTKLKEICAMIRLYFCFYLFESLALVHALYVVFVKTNEKNNLQKNFDFYSCVAYSFHIRLFFIILFVLFISVSVTKYHEDKTVDLCTTCIVCVS